MRCFLTARLITVWLITITIDFTVQSEILIIRHGRSRSRHSVEKDHVRWGLKALDNLTLIESRFEESFENETNSEQNLVNFYENNGTLSQSNEFNVTVGSYEINYTHSPSGKVGDDKKHHREWHHQQQPQISTTTEITKKALALSASISGKRRKERKKEIMTNIKSTVNKGIQYLKSHENLDEIQIEIKDFNTAKKRAAKTNKKRTQSMSDQPMKLKQQHKSHSPMQIKINGGKELGTVTILRSEGSAENHIGNPALKSKKTTSVKSISQRHAAKHINRHQVHSNQMDLSINTNLADVFYVPTSTQANSLFDEQMQGDEPVGNIKKIEKPSIENSNHKLPKAKRKNSDVAASFPQNSTKSIKDKSQGTVASQDSEVLNGNGENRFDLRSNVANEIMNSMDRNGQENNQQIDDIDIENEDSIDTIQNDGDGGDESSDNSVEIEAELDENNINGIYHVEDLDLSDFDETSRNNRKNLMRGRDVVTRFLQIVESQHVLGGNCTAGTALNLGEGVVDRYAQDRFRVEAEVAVNRANMLTR